MTAKSYTQKVFDQLCQRCGLQPWNMEDPNGEWQELCLRIFFTHVPGVKSKSKKSFDQHLKIYSQVEACHAFAHLTDDGNEISKRGLRKKTVYDYAKRKKMSAGQVRASIDWIRKKMEEAPWLFHEWEHRPNGAELPVWFFARRIPK